MTPLRVSEYLTSYREVREEVERSLLPLATSVDGRSFEFQASLHDLVLHRGDYVTLQTDGERLLGQVTDLDAASEVVAVDAAVGLGSGIRVRLVQGSGRVLDARRPFHDATVAPAAAADVAAWFSRHRPSGRAGLTIGELSSAAGVPATLDAGGFDRHTFLCGQSGSGKTYSLGVLLERILAETRLRVVVLDPNSDHVGLGRVRTDADPALAARYTRVPDEVAVWSNEPGATHQVRLRFADLQPAVQAAVLGLDPVRDREEYAALVDLVRAQEDGRPLVGSLDQLVHAEDPGVRGLGLRAVNLGVLGWALWSPTLPSLVEEIRRPTSRCVVVDLGSVDGLREQQVVANAVLSTLWETRTSREPCLLVIDEAHHVCPADPVDDLLRHTTERAVQIAAEGRKYGRYLLVSTQRPHKVHENVVSQCDNLLLMRMNSDADLADLSRLFSFVPTGLMAGATAFRMGEALVAGKVFPHPAYVRIGARVTVEGGSDVPTTWADRGGVTRAR